MKRFWVLMCLISSGYLGVGAEKNSLKNYIVDDIVITATRSPLPLKSTPVITRVIHCADIEKSGVQNLQSLLERELAGVEFHQAGYGSSLSFQGLDARYVLFLIDGERIAGETYGNVDYSRIHLNNIDRIEIVRGASSVLYGSNAMGAVVNIITKMPQNKIEVGGSFRYGTRYQNNEGEELKGNNAESSLGKYRDKLDLPNTKSELSLGLNFGKFKSLSSASYRTSDAYKIGGTKDEVRHYDRLMIMKPKMTVPPGGGRPVIEFAPNGIPIFEAMPYPNDTTFSVAPDARGLGVSGFHDLNLYQRFDYELSDEFRFQVSGGYFSKERYDFQSSIMDENQMSGLMPADWGWESFNGYDIKALMEHSPNQNNKIYLSFARNQYSRDKQSTEGVATPKQRHTYNNPRLLWTLNTKYNRITTGIEMVGEQLNFDLRDDKNFHDRKDLNSGSLYVQDEILTGKKLSFVAGLRGEYSDRFGWSVTPKLSAKYNIGDFSLRANYSNGYRTPSLKEMYMELKVPGGVATIIRGNDKLKAEKNNYYSLSAEYSVRRLNVSATAYRNNFKNKIDVRGVIINSVNVLQYDNIKNSNLTGVELTAMVIPVNGLKIAANYNYVLSNQDASSDGSTQYIFPSRHTATMTVNYDYMYKSYRIGATASVRYVGAKDYEDFMPVMENFKTMVINGKPMTMPTKYYTGTYTSRHKGYATANAAINVEWSHKVMLTMGIDNIFNYQPSIVNFNSAVLPMRNGFVQLSFKL